MKGKIVCLVILIGFSASALSQNNDERTKEKEIVISGPGKITLETGIEITGFINYSMITFRKVPIKKEDGSSETYKIPEVKSFVVNDTYFEKILYTGLLKEHVFASLLSKPNGSIKVYDISWQEPIAWGKDVDAGVWPTHHERYVYFPAIGKLKTFSDVTFIPFVKKVGKLVEDCPDVLKMINQKEKGYTIGLLSTDDDKMNVFINIANLSALCKAAN